MSRKPLDHFVVLGEAQCHSAEAGAEICVWQFDYRSEVAGQRFPSVLTCILPADAAPRPAGSCQLDAK